MKRVLTALVLIPVVLLVVFRGSEQIVTSVIGIFAIVATWEYLSIVAAKDAPFKTLTAGATALLFFGLTLVKASSSDWQIAGIVALLLTLAAPFLFMTFALLSEDFTIALRGAALSTFAFPYISAPLLCLVWLRSYERETAWYFFLLLFLMVWSGDIFAYYVGKSIGKHKLAPRVSPGKTWEGAIASLVGCVLFAWIFVHYSPQIQQSFTNWRLIPDNNLSPIKGALQPAPFWLILLIAIFTNVAAQIGDLVESMMKRGAGVKDSGKLLPGHGGVLDRIDALLFGAPVAVILFSTFREYFFTR
jgi:phosphatidate cytidylyltransferase